MIILTAVATSSYFSGGEGGAASFEPFIIFAAGNSGIDLDEDEVRLSSYLPSAIRKKDAVQGKFQSKKKKLLEAIAPKNISVRKKRYRFAVPRVDELTPPRKGLYSSGPVHSLLFISPLGESVRGLWK
ncbi:predicted protein [Sclerotinia sclerotiorum 1980 UF-70]|uniref:Uncharacterized protein n=1 Tax=Sclerotinia sclerotiorum (strain ATCC 18683 / 1980 / Ss-1) TaxID=665079 RepID=A7E7L3_SCLS1|nr:predicted protein [Sclerotinia sclerotiorum 1980 UF-70]EDN96365.1 predicted protein [Sclerotinia sclerotiorum 1980 UF-70]